MQNVYTHEEVTVFVDTHLKKIGTESMHDKKINDAFVGMISQLPPEWQVLFIEPHHHSVVADEGDISRLYRRVGKEFESVLGFFYMAGIRLDNFYLNHPSAFQRQARGNIGEVTVMHEKGHDFDSLLAAELQLKDEKGNPVFFSSVSKDWHKAVENEANRQLIDAPYDEKDPEEILEWSRERLSSMVSAHIKTDSLYDDYRPLMEHLALYDTKAKRHNESFAEMCTHYATLYTQTGGNKASIDLKLTKRYPELWPHFRDDVLPKLEAVAVTYLVERDANVAMYVMARQELSDYMGEPADLECAERDARIALAKGMFDGALRDITRLLEFFKDPFVNYAGAVAGRDELYYTYKYDSVLEINENREKQAAYEIVQNEGFMALGEAFLTIDRERRSFRKFIDAYDSCVQAISPDYSFEDYFGAAADRKNPVDVFCALYQRDGERTVGTHLEYLPSAFSVHKFKAAYTESLRVREGILGTEPEDRKTRSEISRQMMEELRHIIESGRYDDITYRTDSMAKVTNLLKSYHAHIQNFVENISIHTGGMAHMPSGDKILEQFREMQEQYGLKGIRKKIRQLKIGDDLIQSYVDRRIEHWDWVSQVSEHGNRTPVRNISGVICLKYPRKEFPVSLYTRIADDLVKAGMDGGKGELVQKQKEFAEYIRSLKAEARGIKPLSTMGESFACSVEPHKKGRTVYSSSPNFLSGMRHER